MVSLVLVSVVPLVSERISGVRNINGVPGVREYQWCHWCQKVLVVSLVSENIVVSLVSESISGVTGIRKY